MKLGNVTGDIYDRSIHKKLNSRGEKKVSGAAYGEDCAIFSMGQADAAWEKGCLMPEDVHVVTAQAQTVYTGRDCGKYAVYAAANQAAAFGAARVAGVLLHILLPADAKEPSLRRTVEQAQEAAESLKTVVADVKASVTPAVREICVTATAVGCTCCTCCAWEMPGCAAAAAERAAVGGAARQKAEALRRTAKADAQIVMTKWAGLEGSAILASRFPEKLRERYPSCLIGEAASFDRFLSILPEAAAAGKSGGSVLCAAAEGGIFRALWTLAECAGVGLEIDLKKIPIRQETVEICNYLDLNPYELMANGSLLCLTEHANALVDKLHRMQIPAAVIGSAAANRDRVIINGEERRFLEPAKADEIYKTYG